MNELTVKMAGYGRAVQAPVSQIQQHKLYGWSVVVDDLRDDVLAMTKDELNDWAARNLPHLDLDPDRMNKKPMQRMICKELNWELPE